MTNFSYRPELSKVASLTFYVIVVLFCCRYLSIFFWLIIYESSCFFNGYDVYDGLQYYIIKFSFNALH